MFSRQTLLIDSIIRVELKKYTFCGHCGMTIVSGEQDIVQEGTATYTDKVFCQNIRKTGYCSRQCMTEKYGYENDEEDL